MPSVCALTSISSVDITNAERVDQVNAWELDPIDTLGLYILYSV